MGARGEIFTTQIVLDNRTYFFNVKENRTGDMFLQIVESKNKNGEAFDRHQIAIFAEDMQNFCKGFENALTFIEKNRKAKAKAQAEKKASKKALYKPGGKQGDRESSERPKKNPDAKRTGRVHVVSKRASNAEATED